ncbi:uncharacterized protein LOC143131330 [Alosa pseudoharengus]|uniref:uncharacterized protein LOC143131330 n=1 Tax=Alosa pseudoharengus TaxID=34774 RepID=UPI003F8BF945
MEPCQRNVFNAWQYRHLFTFQNMRGKNVVVMCNLCTPKVNLLSTSRYSTSNLKKHLERRHMGVFQLFKTKKPRAGKQEKSEPGPSSFDQIMQWEPPAMQVKIETPEQFEQEVTHDESQAVVDSLIFNFIMEGLQPPSLLEQPGFKKLIEGVSGGMMVMTKETLVDRLQREQIQMREELKAKLNDVLSVCTTVDIWTARKKSYLTMMCHWVDSTDLQRKSAALACTRIRGTLTYDTVAAKIHEVHVAYSLENKVQALVTDSGSSFVQAFHEFLGVEDQEDEGEVSEFFDLNALLSTPPQEGAVLFLPPHQQCIAHVLSLVATEDLVKALTQHTTCSVYSSAMAKCSALWSKVHQPSEATEDEKPVKVTSRITRWNFEYEAIEDLMSLNDVQLEELCYRKNVAKLLLNEICFLKEYVEVLKPLAISLNIFQGEDRCFFGLAIPTLLTLKQRLREKKTKMCIFPDIIDSLLAGIDRRFAPIFSNQNAKLAAATMPQFRLWWLSEAERGDLKTALMGEAVHIDPDAEDESDSDDMKLEDEFFNFGPRDSSNQRGPKLEVQRYLESTTKTLQCLQDYPSISKLFLKFNTILTSSAPVDRLFSHGGVCTPQQSCVSDEHLEQLLLLRYNGLPICTTV